MSLVSWKEWNTFDDHGQSTKHKNTAEAYEDEKGFF